VAAEKSGDLTKAREYYGKVVAIADGADKDRAEVADAQAFLRRR
jgi:extradiol dioxygenase family protein